MKPNPAPAEGRYKIGDKVLWKKGNMKVDYVGVNYAGNHIIYLDFGKQTKTVSLNELSPIKKEGFTTCVYKSKHGDIPIEVDPTMPDNIIEFRGKNPVRLNIETGEIIELNSPSPQPPVAEGWEETVEEQIRASYQNGLIDGTQNTNCEKVVVAELSRNIIDSISTHKALCEKEAVEKEKGDMCLVVEIETAMRRLEEKDYKALKEKLKFMMRVQKRHLGIPILEEDQKDES